MVFERIRNVAGSISDANPFEIERNDLTNIPTLRFENAPETLQPQPERTFEQSPLSDVSDEYRPGVGESFASFPDAVRDTTEALTPGQNTIKLVLAVIAVLAGAVALGQLFTFELGS